LLREARRGDIAEGIIAAVNRGMETPPEKFPKLPNGPDRSALNPALADLLRVLLKAKADEAGVAQKLIASSADLDNIASGHLDGLWRKGWRGKVFGEDALRLVQGDVGLGVKGSKVVLFEL